MSISLAKGQKISLAKTAPGLENLLVGLGWDPAKKKGGWLGFGGGAGEIDLDASVITVDQNKNILEFIYFGKLRSKDGSIVHSGDNLTGEGDGDDEAVNINLTKVPASVEHIVITVSSFRGQTFDEVENAFCRLVNSQNNQEICNFKLEEKGRNTGFIMAVISRSGSSWTVESVGIPANGKTAQALVGPVLAQL